MSDLPDDNSLQETLDDTYEAIQRRDDIVECDQARRVLFSIYTELLEEKRKQKKAKQSAEKEDKQTAYRIAQSKLDFVDKLLSIDGLEEQGHQLELEQTEREQAKDPVSNVSKQQENTALSPNPGHLHVTVDDINNQVRIVAGKGGIEQKTYSRYNIVGKGKVTWDLLVDFAKCKGLLEGNTQVDVKGRNTPANRKNLGNKLMVVLGLDKSPLVEGRSGVMRFASIALAGDKQAIDALNRKTVSLDDQTSAFLISHGDDIPPD